MKNLLVHIGYHKTGTTWLQKELFIPSNNVFESLTTKEYCQSTLASKFILNEQGYMISPFCQNEKAIKKELLSILKLKRDIKNKVFVMTSERLSGYYGSGGIDARNIAHRIHHFFPNAKIFITIREQKSFICSAYFQYLSKGGVWDIKKYLSGTTNYQLPYFSPTHFTFNHLIEEYQNLFGRENILVLPYELFKENPKCYIEELGKFVGKLVEIEPHKFHEYINEKQHHFVRYNFRFLNYFLKSSSHNHFSFLYNEYTKFPFFVVRAVLQKTVPREWDRKTKEKVRRKVDEWVASRYVESNKDLSKLIETDLSKYGYY